MRPCKSIERCAPSKYRPLSFVFLYALNLAIDNL